MALHPALNPIFILEYAAIQARLLDAMPAPRAALRRPPIWELLQRAGVSVGVVHFPFTFPADQTDARVVVSDRVVTDLWDLLGVRRPDASRLVAPDAEATDLLRYFTPTY